MANNVEAFTFNEFPKTLAELTARPEASLDTPFKTVALCIAALTNYKDNEAAMWEMLEFLNGPENVNEFLKQFMKDRLKDKEYKVLSFFKGATPENGYTPNKPYVLEVSDNPYSYPEENWATLYLTSGGADSPRPVKLRKKPSTGRWFINDIQCLSDIRVPASEDPWA